MLQKTYIFVLFKHVKTYFLVCPHLLNTISFQPKCQLMTLAAPAGNVGMGGSRPNIRVDETVCLLVCLLLLFLGDEILPTISIS